VPEMQTRAPRGEAAPSPIVTARAVAVQIRAAAEQIERDRRLPVPLVEAMARAGIFRLCVPRALGGGEVDAATTIRTIEELSRADGSAGWCAMIGATTGVISAYLREDAAEEIYGRSPNVVTGGVYAPQGRAVVVDGGYRVSGRWAFASGCQHCAWLLGGCVVLNDGAPRLLPRGIPDSRLMLFRAADAEVIDTWTVSGLRGTGSHDIGVSDIFVPEARSVSLLTDRARHAGPLYRFPVFGLLALGIAGVAIGVARSAIDELTELAGAKTPTGSRRRLAERAAIQAQVAEAEAVLRSARAFLFDTVGDAWQAAVTQQAISIPQRALLRLAATHATISAAKVVDLMYNAGGGTSVYAASPLQRHFRDIHVVTQHMMVAPPTYELTGRVLLGIDTDTSML
jgi:alkylation response protein AidB-like acyl-CoA dehydrogenase